MIIVPPRCLGALVNLNVSALLPDNKIALNHDDDDDDDNDDNDDDDDNDDNEVDVDTNYMDGYLSTSLHSTGAGPYWGL